MSEEYISDNFEETRQIYTSLLEKKKQLKGGRATLIDNNLKILNQRIKEIEDKKRIDLLTILDEVEKLLPLFTDEYILENPLDSRVVYEKYSKTRNSLKGIIDSKVEEKVRNSIDTLLSRIENVEKEKLRIFHLYTIEQAELLKNIPKIILQVICRKPKEPMWPCQGICRDCIQDFLMN